MSIVNPGPQFDGITGPTKVVTFDMVLSTAAEVPETVVYKAVKALYEGKKDLAATFAPFNGYDPAQIAKPVVGVTYHPGAVKFFQEAGVQPKS
jgi:hypothetical protein